MTGGKPPHLHIVRHRAGGFQAGEERLLLGTVALRFVGRLRLFG